MKRSERILALAFLAAGTLAGCGEADESNRLVGQLESDRIELTAETFEPIIERAVIEGETVSAGQIILRQDTARVLTRMDEAEAALQQKRARYDELVRGPRRELI
ncbi:MAG: hemolysin D, partial [Proteobacteria bacterium]|nr:hemolysin D [Pseudomonadota bacterium]